MAAGAAVFAFLGAVGSLAVVTVSAILGCVGIALLAALGVGAATFIGVFIVKMLNCLLRGNSSQGSSSQPFGQAKFRLGGTPPKTEAASPCDEAKSFSDLAKAAVDGAQAARDEAARRAAPASRISVAVQGLALSMAFLIWAAYDGLVGWAPVLATAIGTYSAAAYAKFLAERASQSLEDAEKRLQEAKTNLWIAQTAVAYACGTPIISFGTIRFPGQGGSGGLAASGEAEILERPWPRA